MLFIPRKFADFGERQPADAREINAVKLQYLSFLLGLMLSAPLVASAQDAEAEGDAAADPAPAAEETPADPAEGATEEAGEDAAADGAADEAPAEEAAAEPEPQPEPEVSATSGDSSETAAETGDPQSDQGDPEVEEEGWHPARDVSGDESTADGPGEGAEEAGGHEGLRYDMETGRWVEDVEPLPWRNSLFIWNNSVSLDTFLVGARRSYNPTYIQTFSLRPRWYFSDSVSVRLREDLNWEVTHNDLFNNSAWFSDLSLGLFDTGIATLPGGVALGGGVTAFAPVSIMSRNCNMIAGFQGTFSLTKVFPEVMTGLVMQGFGSFRGNVHSDNVCSTEGGDVYGQPAVVGPIFGDTGNTGGLSNSVVSGQLGAALSLSPIPALNFSTTYLAQWSLGRNLADATVPVISSPGGTMTLADGSDTHTRVFVFFSVSATWLTNEWLNISLSYGSFNTALDGSGNVYNPFYNPQSQFTAQAVFVLDRVYQGLEGMMEGDDEEEDPFATARRDRDEAEEDSQESTDESDARAANEMSTRAAQ